MPGDAMPVFKNVSGDDRNLVGVGLVKAGDLTPDLTDEQAAGIELQTTVWAPEKAKPADKENK